MRLIAARIILLGFALVSGVMGCHDAWTKHFESLDSARKDGLVDKGWIPRFIPEDSTNIVVSGDLDSGVSMGSFFSKNSDSLHKHCLTASDSFPVPDYALRWLDMGGTANGDAASLKIKGYDVLDCGVEGFDVAYSQSKRQFYYWTPRKK